MKIRLSQVSFSVYAALAAWSMVFGICLYLLVLVPDEVHPKTWLVSVFFVLYIACFLVLTTGHLRTESSIKRALLLCGQLFSAYALMWLLPLSFLSILTIIWVAVLPFYYSLRVSVVVMLAVVLSWFLIFHLHWADENTVFSVLLYGTFHLFSVFMNHETRLAEDAKEESLRLNQELQATQGLLQEATRQNERTRIARDLHDLLGHHLTALIINLQVAGHLSEGEAKDKVDQCHSLAKLLLSDVREAVSTIRENQFINFDNMVNLMIGNIPRLKVTTNIESDLALDDLPLARTLLSCIQEALTNSLRHSGATEFSISLKSKDGELVLEMFDNGRVNGELIKGNGLKGFEERASEQGGSVVFSQRQQALQIRLTIPLNADAGSGRAA